MTDRAEANRLVAAFVQAWNGRDVAALAEIFHPDFQWHIAVTAYDDPTLRPLQSKLLAGKNLPWAKSIYDKAETLAIFGRIFAATNRFAVRATSVIVDGDKIAIELVGDALNEANGRRYDNLYCYVFHTAEGKITLFREYQDTLLLFDAWVAD